MKIKIFLAAAALAVGVVLGLVLAARPKVDQVTARVALGDDGAALYSVYCASCHGESGRGDGRATDVLKVAVPDLTTLAERRGAFDRAAVLATIDGQGRAGYHEMPGLKAVFASAYATPARERAALDNLVTHLEKLQTRR